MYVMYVRSYYIYVRNILCTYVIYIYIYIIYAYTQNLDDEFDRNGSRNNVKNSFFVGKKTSKID